MGRRSTVYNTNLTTEEEWNLVLPLNRRLAKDFVNYCRSTDRSPQTVGQYEAILRIFFVWNLRHNENKSFIDLRKRDLICFMNDGQLEYGWSSARLAMVKAVLSSMSNYIERILDDEFPTFKNIVKVLEPVHVEPVREKTVLSADTVLETMDKLVEEGDIQRACWLALMFSSGMRKSEVIQMKDSFFVPENILFDVMYRTPKIRTKGRGRKGKVVSRYVFVETFQKYLDLWRAERERLGITLDELFVVNKGDHYEPAKVSTLNSWAQVLSKRTGEDIYCHAYRHCWVSSLQRKHYPDSVIQNLQNWANVEMVSVYSDIPQEEGLQDFFMGLKNDQE